MALDKCCLLLIAVSILCDLVFAQDGINCDFERGICGWEQMYDDQSEWYREKDETITTGTGPKGDHTTGRGYYIHFDSGTHSPTRLMSPLITPSEEGECFTFWYHMHGRNLNTLRVLVYDAATDREVARLEGVSEDLWKRREVALKETKPYNIILEALKEHPQADHGDIALDDFHFTNYTCPSSDII